MRKWQRSMLWLWQWKNTKLPMLQEVTCEFQERNWLENEEVKASHWDAVVEVDVILQSVFARFPERTDWLQHDVDVGRGYPNQASYRPSKVSQ